KLLLFEKFERKGFKPFFAGSACPCLALWFEGKINIFHLGESFRIDDKSKQFGCKLLLLFYRSNNRLFSFVEFAKLFNSVPDVCDSYFIHTPGHFLAVAGNKRNGRSFIKKIGDGLHVL